MFYLLHALYFTWIMTCFLQVGWLTNITVYCSVHCIFSAVQHCSTHQTRCVCCRIFLFVMHFLYKVHNTCRMRTLCPVCLLGALWKVFQIIDIWGPHLKVLKRIFSLDKPSLIPTLHWSSSQSLIFLWYYNIKMPLKEMNWQDLDWINLAQEMFIEVNLWCPCD